MAKFPFDAVTMRSDWSTLFGHPLDCAEYLWNMSPADYQTLAELVESAPWDQEAYDAVWHIARNTTDAKVKLATFGILVSKRPDKRVANTKRRDHALRLIANILVTDYGLNLTRNEATDSTESAASVLERLDHGLSEVRLNAIIGKTKS